MCVLVLALVSCDSDGDEPFDEDAVLVTQGTNPRVEGLSIGVASVGGDEAGLSIAQPGQLAEPFSVTAGEMLEVGDYTVEILEVLPNDEGGAVRLKVTPPEASA